MDEARAKRGGRWCIPNDEIDDFTKLIAEKRQELSYPESLAMPLQYLATAGKIAGGNSRQHKNKNKNKHNENIAFAGYASEEYYAMVHLPIPQDQIRRNEGARKAVDEEKRKLD